MIMTKAVIILFALNLFISGCVYRDNNKVSDVPQNTAEDGKTQNHLEENKSRQPIHGHNGMSPQDILKDIRNFIEVNKPMEDFEAEDLNGNRVRLSDFKGNIIFLNFWATWCPPCRHEMPYMEEFYNEYKDHNVVVLAVSSTLVELRERGDDQAAEKRVRDFIHKNGYTFPVLFDRNNQGWEIYYYSGIPANYIIDTEGIVRYFKLGPFSSKQEMERFVQAVQAMQE